MGKSKGKNSKVAQKNPIPESNPSSSLVDLNSKSTDKEKEEEEAVKKLPEPFQAQECPICKSLALSRCGGCNEVAYCSREHQKLHWKVHKSQCVLWKICESPQLGRYLVATRDIKPGKIVIQENPLLVTPPKNTSPICLGCYYEIIPPEEEASNPGDAEMKPGSCKDGCGWPMCNTESCKEDRADHKAECTVALDREGVTVRTFGQDHPMYLSVGILRALHLRETRPEDYAKFISLESHEKQRELKDEEASEMGPTQPDNAMTMSIVLTFFQLAQKNVTEELIRQISGIIETNGHEIPLPGTYGQISRRLIGVYHVSSFLEHNCRPNCTKSWDSKSKAIVIRASIDVKKGDHLSISYVDPIWGTNDRQNFLQMTKFFTCQCERCLDPTELGCHISSIRCNQIQCSNKIEIEEKIGSPLPARSTGMLVPEDPMDPMSEWKCITCNEVYPVRYVSSIVERIGQDLEEFQDKRGNIGAEEEFIRKFSKTLAPNHFYLLEIKVELAQLYGRTADEPLLNLSPQKLLRKIVLCEELLLVINVIVPGLNRLRGLILYELQAAYGTLSKIKHNVGDISTQIHLAELLKCRQWLNEAVKVLAWEPELSVEYRRCVGARIELGDLEALIAALIDVQNTREYLSSQFNLSQSSAPPTSNLSQLTLTSGEDEDELELF